MATAEVRFKCIVADAGDTKVIVLRKPISYEKLRAEIASAFGAVDITYHHDQDVTTLIKGQGDLDQAVKMHIGEPRKLSMKLVLHKHSAPVIPVDQFSPLRPDDGVNWGSAMADLRAEARRPHSPPPGSFLEAVPSHRPVTGGHRRTASGVASKSEGQFIPEAERTRARGKEHALSSSFHSGATSSFRRGGGAFQKEGDEDAESGYGGEPDIVPGSKGAETFPRSKPKMASKKNFAPGSYPGRIKSRGSMRDWDDSESDPGLGGSADRLTRRSSGGPRNRSDSHGSLGSHGGDRSGAKSAGAADLVQPVARGQWRKGKFLGSGAFGQVFLAYDAETGVEFAVKQVLYQSESGETSKEVESLEREIKLLKSLRHERIVQYYDTRRTPEFLAIFMEYVPGRSLHARLKEYGAFQDELVRKYTRQVLEGLAYLHSQKVIHRDIKGANVLADAQGSVKLADFGASKKLQSIKSLMSANQKSVHGTPYWMSPEAINGSNGGHSFKSDVWSTGALVVEMLTTDPPFWQCEPVTALFKIGQARKPSDLEQMIPAEAHAEAKALMRRCFQLSPRDRPTALQLLEDPYVAL